MNERIKQLAEVAGFVLWQDESWNPGDVIDWSCRYDDEFKKFAELIVRECASRVDNILRERKDGGGTMGDGIREHFGVER